MPAIEVKPEEVVGATMRAARAPQKQEDEISLRSKEEGGDLVPATNDANRPRCRRLGFCRRSFLVSHAQASS